MPVGILLLLLLHYLWRRLVPWCAICWSGIVLWVGVLLSCAIPLSGSIVAAVRVVRVVHSDGRTRRGSGG